MAQLRYEETMDAIQTWILGQGKGTCSPAEAIGIAKAFLRHASMGFALSLPGCDESDAKPLMDGFLRVVSQLIDEKEL